MTLAVTSDRNSAKERVWRSVYTGFLLAFEKSTGAEEATTPRSLYQ